MTEVVGHLVADDDRELGVAGAIGRGALNRQSRLVVRSDFGRVRIGGVFASAEAAPRPCGSAPPSPAWPTPPSCGRPT